MSYPLTIHFTPRTNNCDWDLVKRLINLSLPGEIRGKEIRWLEDKVFALCLDTIIPALGKRNPEQDICDKVMRQFLIRNKRVHDQNSIDLLKEFARYKGKTVADVIQIYIIDKVTLEQEKKHIIL